MFESIRASGRLRSRLAAAVLFAVTFVSPAVADDQPPLTLDDLFATPRLTGTPPTSPVWSPDSRHFAFSWNDSGGSHRDLWIATATGDELRRVASESAESVRDIAWLPDGETIISVRGGDLWETSLAGDADRRLASPGAGVSGLSVAPDGGAIAFLQAGDLWRFELESGELRRLTDVGIGSISDLPLGRYRRPEREIGPGIWGGPTYAWSPDGQTIAVHHVDRRDMRKVPFPDYLAPETDANEVRRGYPGDANESRRVGLLDVATGSLELLNVKPGDRNQIIDFSWSPRGVLLVDVASDTNEDRWLFTVDPERGEVEEIWHSHRSSRIYTSFASTWHPDGSQVIFLSDLEDRYGLFVIDSAVPNSTPSRLTDPHYDVLGNLNVSNPGRSVFYTSNGAGPYERHVYRTTLDDPMTERVTRLPGQINGVPSPNGRHLAFVHSDDVSPPEIYAMSVRGGVARRVTHSPLPAFSERDWVTGRYVSFPSAIDDYTLHARILEPEDLDAGRQYPVIFGPMYSNTARKRWAGNYSLMQQWLVRQGYIVVQVDVRGSTGYGREFREEFLMDFAGDDIEDIASAVEYMKTLPYVDADRFGIWGSSYGGTLSIYTLLKKPGLFRAGVAAAAAVEPHFFGTDDVAIVRRPATHPEVFTRTAAQYADNLSDHLLIIHGMQDQVVPFKTTAALADVLIRRGKDFDFAFAPGATHGWSREPFYARYLFGKLAAHFDRYLMPASE